MRILVACGTLIAMAGCSGGGGASSSGGPVPVGWPQISLSAVARGFTQPVRVTHAGDGSGRIWGIRKNGAGWDNALLADTTLNISTFGEDESGNVYVVNHTSGDLLKVLSP